MKANRAFLNNENDDAVSPVIAVILMVAITVVLAATVYVWVSGFSGEGSQAKNLSVSQVGTLETGDAAADTACSTASLTGTPDAKWCAKFTLVSVSPNFAATGLKVTDATTSTGDITCAVNGDDATSTALAAGDTIACHGTGALAVSGDKFNFIDTAANTVVATITIS